MTILYPDIFSNADDSLFKATLKNSYHVLYPYLPESEYQHYHLRHITKPSYLKQLTSVTETISCACCTRTVISLLSHPAAVLLSPCVFVFAILETLILLTV